MLVDIHCHIDAYPQPALTLAAGRAAGISTLAATISLASYVRTRILCRHHPEVRVALGLHPHRAARGYEHWSEWKEVLSSASLVGEVGLDFQSGKVETWAAQARVLQEIAEECGRGDRVLVLHSRYAEAEAWDIVTTNQVRWVVWHDYRAEAPRSLLYRALEAGHFLAVGPDAMRDKGLRSRLRAIPREQILTETNGPWSCLGTGDRAAALREILRELADTWQCSPAEAEAQVEANLARILSGLDGEPEAIGVCEGLRVGDGSRSL